MPNVPHATEPRRRRRSRWAWACGSAAVVLFLGLVGAWIYLDHSAGVTLSKAARDADRLDPGWTLAELERRRRRPADEENAALRADAALRYLPRGFLGVGPYYEEWAGPFRGSALMNHLSEIEPPRQFDPGWAAGLRQEVADLEPLLDEARPLADMRWGRYDVSIRFNWIATLLPKAQNSRELARALQFDAYARAEAGDIDGALYSCRAILGTARAFGDEPFCISQLVRTAIDHVGLLALQRVLAQGQATDGPLAKMQSLLAEEEAEPVLLYGLRGERAGYYDLFDKLSTGQMTLKSARTGGPGVPERTLLGSLAGPYYRYNQGVTLDTLNRAVEGSKLPLAELAAFARTWEATVRPPDGAFARYTRMLADEFMPAANSFFGAEVRRRGMLNAAQALIAAERFRLARGRWPKTLDEIPRSILPDIPLDPYDGRPVKLARRADGLTVYLTGPDGVDDGGKIDPKFRVNVKGFDWGMKLWDVAERRQAPKGLDLPPDVFQAGRHGPIP